MARRTPTPPAPAPAVTHQGRHTTQGGARALVAAAKRVRLDDRKAVKAAALRQDWQEDAWSYFDEVPEVKFAVLYVANLLSKLRLYVAAYPPNAPHGAKPVPVDDPASGIPPAIAASAKAELARLKSTTGGHPELLGRLSINLDVAGECHVVGFAANPKADPPSEEEWVVASTSELSEKSGALALKASPDDRNPRTIAATDTAFRVWLKHGRWAGRADSHLRGVLSTCRTLNLLSRQVDAETMSRLSAGILLMPNEIEGKPATLEGEAADGEGASDDPFLDDLEESLAGPIDDPGSASAVVPLLLRAAAEHLKEVRHVSLSRTSDQFLDGRIDKHINRLARGLNVPVEVTMGHMSTTYANASQIARDKWEDYLEPRAVNMVDGITYGFMRPNLTESFPSDPEPLGRLVVWYDEENLIFQPDPIEAANDAWDRDLLSDKGYRLLRGIPEDLAPDDAELLARHGPADPNASLMAVAEAVQKVYLGVGVVITIDEARAIVNEAGGHLGPTPPELAPPEPAALPSAPVAPAPAQEPIEASARTRTDAGARLAAIDRELRTRLLAAANAAMGRALERAGNRLKSKATGQRATLARVPVEDVAATLGTDGVAALVAAGTDELFADAWDELERQYREWGAGAQSDALDLAGRVASKWTLAQRAELKLRQAVDLDEGWGWLRDALSSLAADRLFDPHPAAPALGEFDPSLRVPPGAIRKAVAIAGGAPVMTTDGQDVFVVVGTADDAVGGIGSGKLLGDAMTDAGVTVEAYRWVYGPAYRKTPFEPHRALDGVEFEHFDDPKLANHQGWPPVAFFIPGDHGHCSCDILPILLSPDEATAAGFVRPVAIVDDVPPTAPGDMLPADRPPD